MTAITTIEAETETESTAQIMTGAEIGRADTRHYAKRQFTWFRHQLPEFQWVKPEQVAEGLSGVIPGRS